MGLPQMWQAGSSLRILARCRSRVALLRLTIGYLRTAPRTTATVMMIRRMLVSSSVSIGSPTLFARSVFW